MIRVVDPADPATAEALVALQRASYAVEAELVGVEDLPPLREEPADLAATGLTFLAELRQRRLLAFLAYAREGDTVDVHRLVVHPSAFRRGLASGLLDAVGRRERDATRHVVATAARNAPALALYRRHGFRPVGERVAAANVRIVDLERVLPSPR